MLQRGTESLTTVRSARPPVGSFVGCSSCRNGTLVCSAQDCLPNITVAKRAGRHDDVLLRITDLLVADYLTRDNLFVPFTAG